LLALALLAIGPGFIQLAMSIRAAVRSGDTADAYKQWIVCQYTYERRDPYEIALTVLRHYESRANQQSEVKTLVDMHDIPGSQSAPGVIEEYGPPVATYPPSAVAVFCGTIGLLPEPAVNSCWAGLNILLAGLFFRQILPHFVVRNNVQMQFTAIAVCLAWALLWPPTRQAFWASQFSFFVLLCAFRGLFYVGRNDWLAGIWLSFALVKPSLVLLFLIVPVSRCRWLVLVIPVGIHAALLLVLSLLLGRSPMLLMQEWLQVSSYFLGGMYSLQDLRVVGGMHGHVLVQAAQITFLAAVTGWCFLNRGRSTRQQISFLCFANLLWIYHGAYDFVALLPPIFLGIFRLFEVKRISPAVLITTAELAAFIVVGIGLWRPVYIGDDPLFRLARWGCRVSLLALLALAFLRCRCGARDPNLPATVAEDDATPQIVSEPNK
jgi:glycosyl transferase family 87